MIGIEAMRRKFVWRTLLVVSLCLVLSVVASETSMNLNNVVKYYGKRVRRPANHKLVDSLLCLVPVVLAWLVYVLIGVATTRA